MTKNSVKIFFCLIAVVSAFVAMISCQKQLIQPDSETSELKYSVSCADINKTTLSKSGAVVFEGTDIPLSMSSFEGIGTDSLQERQNCTRGTLYNNGDKLSPFKVCIYDGNEEFAYDKEVTWNGKIWRCEDNLTWPYGKSLRFLAYANEPESGFELNSYPTLTEMNVRVDGNPANQNDILIGYYSGIGNPKGTADIQFQHPMTAVLFKLGDIVTPRFASVKSITIHGVAQTARFTTPTSVDDENAEWIVDENDTYDFTVTQNEPKSGAGLPVSEEGVIGDAFLLIPQDLTDNPVSVEVVLNLGSGKYFLCAKLDKDIWKRSCTNVYTIGYEEELSDYSFTIDKTSLVYNNSTTSNTKKCSITSSCFNGYTGKNEAVDFTVDYSIDGGVTWAPYDAAVQGQSGITMTVSSPSSYVYTVNLAAAKKANVTTMPVNRWSDDTIVASDWDLSKCDVGGEGYRASNQQNSANTYIVKHPGTYRFPCVYGNSLKNGSASDAGFKSTASGTSVMSNLYNAIGTEIQSSYILEDVKDMEEFHPRAALLFTDTKTSEGNPIINNVNLNYNPDYPENAYISFGTLDKNELIHGNAIIILYNDKDNDGNYLPFDITTKPETSTANHYKAADLLTKDIVLWSWQIWVTDADLSAQNTLEIGSEAGETGHAKMMSRYLGWNDGDVDGVVNRYAANDGFDRFKLRFTQKFSGSSYIVSINQQDIYTYLKGSVPFYQYGRNVPSQGAITRSNSNKQFYFADGSNMPTPFKAQIGSTKEDPIFYANPTEEGQAVTYTVNGLKLPYIFIQQQNMDNFFSNLWSLNDNGSDINIQTVKTVYDPSPYGYKIPNWGLLISNLTDKFVLDAVGETSYSFRYYNETDNRTFSYPRISFRTNNNGVNTNNGFSYFGTSSVNTISKTYSGYVNNNNGVFTQNSYAKGGAFPIVPILDE